MGAMRGKVSNLAAFSKIFNSLSYLSQPNNVVGSDVTVLMRLRMFSGQSRRAGFNDFDDRMSDNDDKMKPSSRDRVNGPSNRTPRRPLRDERELPPFRGLNAASNRNRGPQGRYDGGRGNMELNDENKARGNVGLVGDDEGKTGSRPSIRELLNKPLKGNKVNRKEGDEFLDKFKLGGNGKKENQSDEGAKSVPSQEEKMETPEDADVIFKKMKQSGLIPNAVAMLDGLCKDGLVQEAMKLFGLMREKGAMPEVVVYTAVVEGFCQAHKLDDAKRIFRKMQDNGIVPNAFSYAVLIKGLCRVKRLEEAVDFSVEMLEAGHSPNVTTFTRLVHEFCKEKGVEEARKIIDALKQKGFYLDEKAVRNYLDKTGPTSPMVWEAIFGTNKITQRGFQA